VVTDTSRAGLSVAVAGRADVPEAISALNRAADRRILITNGCVISMDPSIGDFATADILIEGDTISRIGPDLLAVLSDENITVLDASGMIVMPGLVDTHRHMWQGLLRRMIPNVDISTYLSVRNAFAVEYRPHDSYTGTLAIALGALYGGVTTILDLAHNTRSAAHADGEIAALRESGIRAVYACAPPEAGEWEHHWPGDLTRLKDELSSEPLVSLRMAQRILADVDRLGAERIGIARDLGLKMTIDPVGWDDGSAHIVELAAAGLLGPDLTFVHCCDLTDDAWKAMGDAQIGVSLSPFVDEILGWGRGYPTVQKALDVGLVPGLSVDIETTVPVDMFTQMRSLLGIQRMRGSLGNPDVDRPQLTARDVLGFATRDGARIIGVDRDCGTLTPGKKADVVLLDCTEPNTFPLNNAYGTAVMGADVSSVRVVMVAGVIKKWGHSLVDVDLGAIRSMAEESRNYLASKVGYEVDLFTDYPTVELPEASLRA
jgi:cytosine/adenosine deaminase-related metal-dependent hydrolase